VASAASEPHTPNRVLPLRDEIARIRAKAAGG
jgi:hypothetical protein